MGPVGKTLSWAAALSVVTIGSVTVYHFLGPQPPPAPVHIVDRLCDFVHSQSMDCVSILSDDTGMRPGSIVEYDPAGPPAAKPPVPFPVADLFKSDACLIQGAHLLQPPVGKAGSPAISIPTFSYDVDRSLHEGLDVEIPKFRDMTFKAGPQWDDIAKIEMSTTAAWVPSLDEITAARAYKSCEVRSSCADYIRTSRYRVVGSTMVAEGLSYRVFDKANTLVSASGGMSSGKFQLDVGASDQSNTNLNATVQSADPRVVGVRLLPTAVFSGQQACQGDFVVTPSATVISTIVGGGGKGSLAAPQTQQKALGELLTFARDGTEESQCQSGFERKVSGASVTAIVEAPKIGELDFRYDIAARGGHYVTVAACPLGKVVGKTGHDTTATALVELRARSTVILRGDTAGSIKIEYRQLPDGSNVKIVDWQGRALGVARKAIVNGDNTTVYDSLPANVSGTGSFVVSSNGAGVYSLDVNVRIDASVTGNTDSTQKEVASVIVSTTN